MNSGSRIKFLALFLIHLVAFRKWLNCGVLRVLSTHWGAFLSSKANGAFWSRTKALRLKGSGWKHSLLIFVACKKLSSRIHGAASILIIRKAKRMICWGSARKPAIKGCNWIKGWTGFVERKGKRTTQACGLKLWNKLLADTSTNNLSFGAIDRNSSKPLWLAKGNWE